MGPAPKAFVTTDFSLAVTLWVLAQQLVTKDGEPAGPKECPEYRVINSKELDKLCITFAEAMRRGLGDIAYGFAFSDERQMLIDTFRKAREEAQTASKTETPDFRIKCECGRDHTPDMYEILATFAGYLFAARKHFADRRSRVGAFLQVPSGTGYELIDPRKQ